MNDKLIKKIQALYNHAEGTNIEAEREAFLAKVNELVEKHQIDLHAITSQNGTTSPVHEIVTRTYRLVDKSVAYKWRINIMAGVAEMCFTKTLVKRGAPLVLIIGYRENIEITIATYEQIVQDLEATMLLDYTAHWVINGHPRSPVSWKNTYASTASYVVMVRAQELVQARQRPTSGVRALTLVNDSAINDWIAAAYPNIRTTRAMHRYQANRSAEHLGTKAGQSIRLTKTHLIEE